MTERIKIGLIGLGNAGQALAQALCTKFTVVSYDLDPERMVQANELGCHLAANLADVASSADMILLSLPTPAATRTVCEGLTETSLEGRLIIETSTVSPSDIAWMVEFFNPHGATVMDSAIVGGVQRLA